MSADEQSLELVDTTTGELVPYVPAAMPATLFRTDEPQEILRHATSLANTLEPVIRQRKLFKKIGDKDHVFVEAWTLLGTMLGVFPVCVWTHKLEDGWEARVEARTRDGAVIGAAEAQCTRAESLWAKREDYALRSMAQTRATSKALRQPLGFVIHLAGFSATPAEEMTTEKTITAKAAPRSEQYDKDFKSAKAIQRKLIAAGLSEDQFRAGVKRDYGTEHVSELTAEQLRDLVLKLRAAEKAIGS